MGDHENGCAGSEEFKRKMAIQERKDIERRADMAVHLIDYYGGDVHEAAKAVGVKRAALEGYRDGTVRCSRRKIQLLENAIRVADIPPEDKQQLLWQWYEKMENMLTERKPIKERFELSTTAKYRVFLERLVSMIRLLREHLHCLPGNVVNRLFWRAEKNGIDVLTEAHIQARGKRPQEGLSRVAEKMLFARLQESARTGVLMGFKGVPVSSAPDGTVEQQWMDGLFLAVCSNTSHDGTDADVAYIPRETLRKYPGLTQRGKLASALWFLPDEDNSHVHLNYAAVGKKALRENEIEVEDTQIPCAVRIPRAECLLFATKYHTAPSCEREDVYNIRMHPSGLTTIDEKTHAIYPVVSSSCPSSSSSKGDEGQESEVLATYLSKLEVFYGLGPAVHDLVGFIRDPLQVYAEEEHRKALEAEGLEEIPSFTVTEDMESFSDEEDEISLDGDDPRVGTILMRVPTGDNGLSTRKERRYVYCSVHNQDEPYYFTKTFNRIFLIDKGRIEYFHNGVEPPEIRRAMKGWPNNAGDGEQGRGDADDDNNNGNDAGVVDEGDLATSGKQEGQAETVAPKGDNAPDSVAHTLRKRCAEPRAAPRTPASADRKVGTIKVQISNESAMFYPEAGEDQLVVMDVFCNPQYEKPYYLTYTGNRIFIVDPSRIIPLHPPRPKKNRRPVVI